MGWMNLPPELLELIFQRLSLIDDVMNCRGTCRSWPKAGDAVVSSELPLMVSLSTPYPSSWSWPYTLKSNNFGSLSAPWSNHDSTVLTETWPQGITPCDINRVHSVQGWLMFNIFHYARDKDQTFSELSFFNPFSRARFKLPKLLFSGSPSNYQVRVAFNSAPPGSEEFVIAFLCLFRYQKQVSIKDKNQRLAFIKFKQGSWIEIEATEIFYDIEVHGCNKLYALTFKRKTRVVFEFSVKDNKSHVMERLVMLNKIENIAVGRIIFMLSYASFKRDHQMVMDTRSGELLVRHYIYSSLQTCGCFYSIRTKGFSVFKLDRSNLRWCEVFDNK